MPSYGHFTVTIHEARGLPPNPGLLSSKWDAFAVIRVSDPDAEGKEGHLHMERRTQVEASCLSPVWEETHAYRLLPGWKVTLDVHGKGLFTDDLIGTTQFDIHAKDGWFPLTSPEGVAAGEVRLSLQYTAARASLAVTVESLKSQQSSDFSLSDELRLLIRTNRGKMAQANEDVLLRKCESYENDGTRSEVFIKGLQDKLRKSVSLDEELHFEELHTSLGEMLRHDWEGPPTLTDDRLKRLFKVADRNGSSTISPEELVAFVKVVILWGVHLSILFWDLSASCGIGLTELEAVYDRFEKLDVEMTGSIPSVELSALLQDMGGSYTEEQVEIIAAAVDAQGDGTIPFASIVRWARPYLPLSASTLT
ncbi:unnamed protein product [Chrysoparadoxa australica]